MSVPDFGLSAAGIVTKTLGDFVAEIAIIGSKDAEVRWRTSSGKLQKSVPADVKRDFPDDLKALKRSLKDLQTLLPAQVNRLERLLVDDRPLEVEHWNKYYLNHPLISHLTRRLIWTTDTNQSFVCPSENFFDNNGNPVDLSQAKTIRLWHPIDFPADVVLNWRTFLAEREISQPFKQAHREIYQLTDAERNTETYSNRFAAHILRQHQFQALCDARGWTYRLMGGFDSHNVPTKVVPGQGRAEFWVEGVPNEMSPSGIFLYLSTDQVRFHDEAGFHLRLENVPPRLFSELMRDVDLFVGVASIGNDPNWQDGGTAGDYNAYWHNFSFGDLTESAKTRRAVLESLLPRLTKIRDRCSLSDKFLIVRGELRSYKIHLGSSNILMEPNDQYLCIVPDGRARAAGSDNLFLPFEGDSTLSIILSKAFLLAEDNKIKDPSITRQITR